MDARRLYTELGVTPVINAVGLVVPDGDEEIIAERLKEMLDAAAL